MARNIYDLFNERKYGVDYLVEGVQIDEDAIDAYDSLEAAMEALEDITKESVNESLELRSAFYLEDLVIESMMYDDFNEENIATVMEGSMRDKYEAAKTKVKKWWEKIKAWFVGTFKAIANHFKSGEALVKQYGKKIDDAMRKSHLKVKMNRYKNIDSAMAAVADMLSKLEIDGVNRNTDKTDARDEILASVGADDRKEVPEKIKELFIDEENVEQKISEIDVNTAKHYAGDKKKIIDGLKKQQKKIDDSFRSTLKLLEDFEKAAYKGDNKDNKDMASAIVTNFNFAITIKNTILNAQMAIVRKACSDYTAVIRRALNAPAENRAAKKAEKNGVEESYIPTFDDISFED
jgi:hypothetical protein